MDALKRFSLAVMAAVLVAGTTPALSQTRDTRPTEPDRPTIEQGEKDGDDERADPAQPGRLPKSSPGMVCELTWDDNEIVGVLVTNDTGKTIAAGTVVTLYVQPGGIQKLYKVVADWPPGEELDIAVDIGGVTSIAACAVKLQPERKGDQLPQPVGETPWYLTGEVSFDCLVTVKWDPPPARFFIRFDNTGEVTIPAGTKLIFTLPTGEAMTYVLEKDWGIYGLWEMPLPYSKALADYYLQSKNPHGCTYTKVETGYNGPAVEEQGPVPQIDPSKVP